MAAVLRANSDGNILSFVFVTRLFFFFFSQRFVRPELYLFGITVYY